MIELALAQVGSSCEPEAADYVRRLRDEIAAASGYNGLHVYVNYAHGDETVEQVYGARNLPRLAQLKRTWDPDNVFRFNNPLPAQYP